MLFSHILMCFISWSFVQLFMVASVYIRWEFGRIFEIHLSASMSLKRNALLMPLTLLFAEFRG